MASSPRKTSARHGRRADEVENNLSMYLKDARRENLLTREEEIELVQKVKDGDVKARGKLIRSNLRFVISIAKKYQNSGIPLEDLISEGNIGLIIAADRFEPSKGYHFISYAVWWVKQAILKAISEKSRLIRLPLNRANDLIEIEKKSRDIFRKFGRDATIEELADDLGLTRSEVSNLINVSRDYVSLEEQFNHLDVEGSLLDVLEDKNAVSPDQHVIDGDLHDALMVAMESLTPIEKEVIEARYGFNGEAPKTLKEIGAEFKLTKERIRQIEKKALAKMRSPKTPVALKDFVFSAN